MKKGIAYYFIFFIFMAILSCGQLEEGGETSISIKDFPGTVKLELPIKWDIAKMGGTWRGTYSTEIRSFNPFASLEGTAYEVLYTIFDGLFDYNPDTKEWTGYLVKDFEVKIDIEKDSMELVCELRDNIYWSDGVQMTADDVIFYFTELEGNEEIYFRGYKSQLIKMDDGTEKQIRIEKIDKFKYKYIFPRIVANPVLMVNGFVLPKHIWEPAKKMGKEAVYKLWGIDTPPDELIGNGPYLLEEYKPVERMIYKRNPNYWRKDKEGNPFPYREKLVFTYIPPGNATASLLKFQKGEIESYALRGQDMATLLPEAEEKGFDIWNGGPSFGYPGLIFNQDPKNKEPFLHKVIKDKRFRQAVSCLIDRATIIDQIINGFAEPFYHFVAENNKYFNPEFENPYQYDPEKAMEILAEMGLKDTDGDSFLEDVDGNIIGFKIMMYGNDQNIIDINNIIIDELIKIGIKTTLEIVDYNVWAERLQYTHDWDCTMLGFSCPTFTEQWTNIWPSYGDRHYWYPNQEKPATEWEARIDELHKKLVHTYEEEEVKELYDEFQQIIIEQLPIIPIYRKYSFLAIYKRWGNIYWDTLHEAGDISGVRIYLREDPNQL